MIRKTGFVNDPDKALYDDRYLAGKGTQAYMYFMWLCLQRCDPLCGQLCFITPSQWTVLEFAENLRKWIWTHCQLLDFFQFEPYKVWPKVQTDSLIFRLCKRQQQSHMIGNMNGKIISKNHHQSGQVMFLRHLSRKSTLTEILYDYQHFDRHHLESQNPLIKYKFTMTDDIELLMTTMHGSFAYLSPTSAVSDQLMALTRDYPRICDGERGVKGSQTPLVWHRGPNTNPVYALVVRTQWALDTFGKACCDEWLRPVFYWNGKSSTPCKEVQFWSPRDPLRLTKKENSPAEAYVPFDGRDNNNIDDSFYSMILVDKEGASRLDKSSALYQYLHEARLALQPGQMDKELAWCHFNKCGMNIGVKLVHPINFGYFSRTQPRQRFFMDQQQ
ncbi:uncharacterized protein BX664DRAFT_235323, partial [Halteromyces radiatus]|uniref:uncharacterized protein n=1 Tax=Halteromyces radiatus TaxID=101107 RepID=UPI00221EDA69